MTFLKRSAAALAVALSAAWSALPASADDAVTLKWTFVNPMESHFGAAALAFKEHVEAASDGSISVEIFPAGALGGEREIVEGVQFGSIDIGHTSTTVAGNFVPEVLIFDVPFLFRDAAHARGVVDGPIGQELLASFDAYGIKALGFGENGFRHLTNNVRPVKTPEDLSGVSIRTMENPIHIKAFSELGARPTPLAWPELYAALQQGVIDGEENPIANILTAKFYQVQKYLSLTGHVYAPTVIAMAPASYEKLSDAQKAVVDEGVKKAIAAQRQAVEDIESGGVAKLSELGMIVEEDIDRAAFAEKLAPAFAAFAEQFGEERLAQIREHQ